MLCNVRRMCVQQRFLPTYRPLASGGVFHLLLALIWTRGGSGSPSSKHLSNCVHSAYCRNSIGYTRSSQCVIQRPVTRDREDTHYYCDAHDSQRPCVFIDRITFFT